MGKGVLGIIGNPVKRDPGKKIYFQVHGTEDRWYMPYKNEEADFSEEILDELRKSLVVEEDEDSITFLIAPDNAKWTKKRSKSVACCAFNATEEYCRARGILGKLSSEDRDWYVEHPATVAAGLPMHDTLSLLQALVAPYDIGISKVWVRPGTNPTQEMRGWEKALGVNPLGAWPSCNVSNSEYIQESSGGDETIAAMFRKECKDYNFEWSHEALGMAVVFHGGNGGGHASFKSPRDSSSGWWMALQYERLENIKYHAPPPLLDYNPQDVGMELDIEESKTNLDTTIRSVIRPFKPILGPYQYPKGSPPTPRTPTFSNYRDDLEEHGDRELPPSFFADEPTDLGPEKIIDLNKFLTTFGNKPLSSLSPEVKYRIVWVSEERTKIRQALTTNKVQRGFSKLAKLVRKQKFLRQESMLELISRSKDPAIVEAYQSIADLVDKVEGPYTVAELWYLFINVLSQTRQSHGAAPSILFLEKMVEKGKKEYELPFSVRF